MGYISSEIELSKSEISPDIDECDNRQSMRDWVILQRKEEKLGGLTSASVWKTSVPFILTTYYIIFSHSCHCECDMNLRISRGFHNKSFFFLLPSLPSSCAIVPSVWTVRRCLKLVLTERPVHSFGYSLSCFSFFIYLFFLTHMLILSYYFTLARTFWSLSAGS